MASPAQWTWVWAGSGSWWWTGKPGVLQSRGLQRVGQDWATLLNWTEGTRASWVRLPFSIPASCPFSLLSDGGWHLWTPAPAHVSVHLPVWVSSSFNLFMPFSPSVTVRVTAKFVFREDCDGQRKCGLCNWWISSKHGTMICTCSLWLLFLDHSELGLKGLAEDAQETNKDN